MATHTHNTPIDHSTDAGFRAWVSDHIALIDTPGHFTDPGDTGQFVAGSGVGAKPGGGSANSLFIVRRFNDALHSTRPYFFRWDYGNGSVATIPRIQLTIGTGSNGSGTITGVILAATTISSNGAHISNVNNYRSYSCGHPGMFAMSFKIGASTGPIATSFFIIERIRGEDGVMTAEGLTLIHHNHNIGTTAASNNGIPCFRSFRSDGASYGSALDNTFCLSPMRPTITSPLGGQPRFLRCWSGLPNMRPMLIIGCVAATEASEGASFPARPFGGVDRTYVCAGRAMPSPVAGESLTAHSYTYSICHLYD